MARDHPHKASQGHRNSKRVFFRWADAARAARNAQANHRNDKLYFTPVRNGRAYVVGTRPLFHLRAGKGDHA